MRQWMGTACALAAIGVAYFWWQACSRSAQGEFGLRPGDILLSVNGVQGPEMFALLEQRRGQRTVCVEFERQGDRREMCLKQE